MARVRLGWTLFEISALALFFAFLLIVFGFQNSFEEQINFGLVFLVAGLFLAAVSLVLRRREDAQRRKDRLR